jgi:hypothetical protein
MWTSSVLEERETGGRLICSCDQTRPIDSGLFELSQRRRIRGRDLTGCQSREPS